MVPILDEDPDEEERMLSVDLEVAARASAAEDHLSDLYGEAESTRASRRAQQVEHARTSFEKAEAARPDQDALRAAQEAAKHGIDLADVAGTGPGGRVTLFDVDSYRAVTGRRR